jgi:hypothetical protein
LHPLSDCRGLIVAALMIEILHTLVTPPSILCIQHAAHAAHAGTSRLVRHWFLTCTFTFT